MITLRIFLADKVMITDLFLLFLPAIGGVLVLSLCLMKGECQFVNLPQFMRSLANEDKLIAMLFLLRL